MTLPISLCMFVKNEEKNLKDCIESILPIVSEIVIVDTGSKDSTLSIAKDYTDRIYQVGFSDFGNIRTITAHLGMFPWIMMLDADERILREDYHLFENLINQPVGDHGDNNELDENGNVVIDSWALPRKRWADKWMRKQEDIASYPDWQMRLFRNHFNKPKIGFERRVHERPYGCVRTEYSKEGPTIHHVQNVYRDKKSLAARKKLYLELYNLDIAEGIEHQEPPVVKEDDV